jgi:O-antigen/teichoic acid export membrane protein
MPPPEDSQLRRRLNLNTVSNLARYVIFMAIAFFLTPFIVRTLGDSQYGFWVLLMSFIGYASMLELGVQPAVVKLVGQFRGAGDARQLQELITAALVFFLVVGAIAATLVVTVVPLVVRHFVEDLQVVSRSRLLFLAIALDAMVMYMNYLVTGILYGWQRYHLKNVIDASGWLLNAVLVLSFLDKGGLLALVACKLTMDVCVVLASALFVRRVFPQLSIDFRALRRGSFQRLMSFGGRIFLSATTTRIATNAQPVIISTALSSAATSFYAIPVKLVDYTRQIAWTLSASFMPMFSELESRNEQAAMRSIYLSYSRYIFMALMPILVLLFVYGASFIGLWIGPEYEQQGRLVLALLVGSALAESFQPLLWRYFIGVGYLNILVKVSALTSGLIVVLAILLVKPLGIAGVALAQLLGTSLAQAIYATQASRHLGVSIPSYFRQVHLRTLVVGAMVFGLARLMFSIVGAESYLSITAGVLPSLLVYFSLSLRWTVTSEERGSLARVVLALWSRRPAP